MKTIQNDLGTEITHDFLKTMKGKEEIENKIKLK